MELPREITKGNYVYQVSTRAYRGVSRRVLMDAAVGVPPFPWVEPTARVDNMEEARADAEAWAEEFVSGDPENRSASFWGYVRWTDTGEWSGLAKRPTQIVQLQIA